MGETVNTMSRRPDGVSSRVLHMTTALAVIAAFLVALIVPALHFYYGHRYNTGSIASAAEVQARLLTQIVGRNPQMWEFEVVRIYDALADFSPPDYAQSKTVRNNAGDVIAQIGDEILPAPVILRISPVYDAGRVVGRLEITRSLRPMMLRSLQYLIASALFGFGIFFALRILPLRLLRRMVREAAFLAHHDALTELPNRTLFEEWLTHSLAEVDRDKTTAAILCLDLDRFKEVNDLLGHAAGDDLLRQASARMAECLRATDFLARLGGDEFAIIQTRIDLPESAARLAERLIETLTDPFQIGDHEIGIGASIGIYVCMPGAADAPERVLQYADLALYRAKSEGRGNYQFFEAGMNQRLVERKALETDLRRAIAGGELELFYQPQIDLATNRMIGVEALLRWAHPERGWIPPDAFIGLAEETGLILPIGDWVIRTACAQALAWPGLKFAVNVSPVQFRHGDLVGTVRAALAETGVAASQLEIEITEGVMLQNTDNVLATLTALKALGVRIAMDDFGTGYSSLGYLRRFPFDKIKIDRSFIADLGGDTQADSIVDAVIGLGRALGMTSNAEGVETREQAEILRMRGCGEVQGYYFARPMPGPEIDLLLAQDPGTGRFDAALSDTARAARKFA